MRVCAEHQAPHGLMTLFWRHASRLEAPMSGEVRPGGVASARVYRAQTAAAIAFRNGVSTRPGDDVSVPSCSGLSLRARLRLWLSQ